MTNGGKMYQVFRNKRAIKSINATGFGGFDTFEQARQALRRYIRKQVKQGKMSRFSFNTDGAFACWDEVSRNPVNYTNMGFSIRKVA